MIDSKSEDTTVLKRWLIAFLIGLLLPGAATVIKPFDYSFYMFFPATPASSVERFRLLAANSLLVLAFIIGASAAVYLFGRAFSSKRWLFLLSPVIIFVHPLMQPIFLESWDTRANRELGNRFRAANLIGRSGSDVEGVFGKPDSAWSDSPHMVDAKGAVIWQREAYTAWEYQPLRFYWVGSKLQVVFKNGVVSGFEANDD